MTDPYQQPGLAQPGMSQPGYPTSGYQVPPGVAYPPQPGLCLAEPGKRLVAHILDGLIISGVSLVLIIPFMIIWVSANRDSFPEPGTRTSTVPPEVLLIYGLIFLFVFAAQFLYETISIATSGATIGKKAMKLRVVRVADGGSVGWGQAAGREVSRLLFGILPCVSYLDPLWLLWDKPNRQTLHDKLAKTAVVSIQPQQWAAPLVVTG